MYPQFLKGVRFADLTWAGAGPFSTKIFSDFGAEVIKVESASRPDPVRVGAPFRDGVAGINRSGYFASRNTNKRSLSVNLKNLASREVIFDLIRQSDVVSNNFGPGAMERLGLGYENVKAIKPDIIYLAMPMYGADGPRSNLLGVGMTISAVTAMMWLTGYQNELPLGPGTHFPDHAANPYHAAFAVLASLRHRRLTGRGMNIDLAQVESTINCMGLPFMEFAATGSDPKRVGNRSSTHAPHNVFRCAGDDSWCAIAVLTDEHWQSLCSVIGRPDLAADAGLATAAGRLARTDEVEAQVASWTAGRDAALVMSLLQGAKVPAGVVADARYVMDKDAQLKHRGYWQEIGHPEIGTSRFTSPPFLLDQERVELRRPPLLGEHTDEVMKGLLGYTTAQVDKLRAQGILE